MAHAIGLVAVLAILPAAAQAQTGGRARVIDGDTLVLKEERIRLSGIDAPEAAQSCLFEGEWWPCGQRATEALGNYIERRSLNCFGVDHDTEGNLLAVCLVEGEDVNGWLVTEGWAIADRRNSSAYAKEERAAKVARKGVWRGSFIEPHAWRSGKRLTVKASAVRNCNIKGEISRGGEKIYHLPSGQMYALIELDRAKGERMFCSEKAALAAGWRPSPQ